jgi:hypothetical protein
MSLTNYLYAFTVGWAIVDRDEEITGNVIVQPGFAEISELGQLILKALDEATTTDKNIETLDMELDVTTWQPMVLGDMQVQISMPYQDFNY